MLQLVFVPGRFVPVAIDGVYVSVPTVVPDFTVKYAKPADVVCGFAVCCDVVAPKVREKFTEYVPVVTTFPTESRTATVPTEIEVLSGGIGFGLKLHVR
jgi:hypothetical protein